LNISTTKLQKFIPNFLSVFIDSPLNKEGMEQAQELGKFIEGDKLVFTQKDQVLAMMKGSPLFTFY
jgi:hypothetical protein